MNDYTCTALRAACGHDSRTIPGCLNCEAAERIESLLARVYDLEGAFQETATFAGAYRSTLQEIADQKTEGLEPHVYAHATLNPE